ncbi:hypothetical protein JCM16358_25330 [Halanaerocella petrolearia]
MKKTTVLSLLMLLVLTTTATVMAENSKFERVEGIGRSVLGNGVTLEQAEEVAFKMAKKHAVSKFGTYIESETVVKNHKLAKNEVTALSAGIVKLVPGSKKATKQLEEGNIFIKITATFKINKEDVERRIKAYTKRRKSSKEVQKLINRVKELEERLEKMSRNEDINSVELKTQLNEITQSYEDIGNALKFDGQKLFAQINDRRIKRLKKLKLYLKELKQVANPKEMFQLTIAGRPKVEDKGAENIEVEVPIQVKLNKSYYRKADRIIEKYKEYIYPNDGKLDNINKELLGQPILNEYAPIMVTFLNSNDEIIAFTSRRANLDFYVHHTNIHNDQDIMNLQRFNVSLNNVKKKQNWIDELPEKIVKEIASIRVIYSKYNRYYFEDKKNYDNFGSDCYVYSTTPVPISKVIFTKKDIIRELDRIIARIYFKIKELQKESK